MYSMRKAIEDQVTLSSVLEVSVIVSRLLDWFLNIEDPIEIWAADVTYI